MKELLNEASYYSSCNFNSQGLPKKYIFVYLRCISRVIRKQTMGEIIFTLLVRYETKASGCVSYIIDVGCLVRPSRLHVAASLRRKALKLTVPGN